LFLVTTFRMRAWKPAFEHSFLICNPQSHPWRKPDLAKATIFPKAVHPQLSDDDTGEPYRAPFDCDKLV
jgi:hypothetical protein